MSLIKLQTPDPAIIVRRAEIVAGLVRLVGAASVIADEDGRRTFESDGLSAYRCMPLAVVLPRSTEEVSQILGFCHAQGVKVL